MLSEQLTLQEAVERAPDSGGGEAVGTVIGAVVGVAGGLFGLLTILILTFYILVDADSLRTAMLRLFPAARSRARRRGERDITVKVSAWLGGQLLLGGIIGATSAIGLWLLGIPFFYVLALISGGRRAHPGRRPDPRRHSRDRGRRRRCRSTRCCW